MKDTCILGLAIFILLFSGCVSQQPSSNNSSDPAQMCVSLCQQAKQNGMDMSKGPCLSNDYYPDYVCDVSHAPREDVDNSPENQCPAFIEKRAHHFVEVNPICNFIRQE